MAERSAACDRSGATRSHSSSKFRRVGAVTSIHVALSRYTAEELRAATISITPLKLPSSRQEIASSTKCLIQRARSRAVGSRTTCMHTQRDMVLKCSMRRSTCGARSRFVAALAKARPCSSDGRT